MRRTRFAERLRARRDARPGQLASDPPEPPVAERSPESQWFWDHYEVASEQVIAAFAEVGVSLEGKAVADVGCGDGIMDLGVLQRARPRSLVGFDINLTDIEYLARRAREEGVDPSDRAGLAFDRSEANRLPAADEHFDAVFSWSAFEHISNPTAVLTEVRRVLTPHGIFFLQLWPFYFSAKGSHLWDWFPEDFHHLYRTESDIVAELVASDLKPAEWTQMMAHEFQHLNRITVDELQRSLLTAGLVARRLELLSSPTTLSPALARYSWLDLGVSGIKLIASRG
jgi:ubiquinone/menaquinone biosynthesis C-methylase UbiE